MPQKNNSGWNPVRRNKKIGTADQGFKARKDFGIPSEWKNYNIFWQRLKNPIALPYNIDEHHFTILIEPTNKNYKYYVSISDLIEVIKEIPENDRRHIKVFAFRQPTKKEALFSHVWGRLGYNSDFGKYWGPCVCIEAQVTDLSYKVEKNVSVDYVQELEILREEGHRIEITKRHFEIQSSPEAIRNTQLYRTLIHEVGHYVDYLEKIYATAEDETLDEDTRFDLYFARPSREKEAFAERYVAELVPQLKNKGVIPFDPIPASSKYHSKIDPDWFYFK